MKNLPVYEHLDTSFVNLSALVRYLQKSDFVGRIRVELDDYEGEITLGRGNVLKTTEHDRRAGRIAEGDEAFERLLIRSRTPGGAIDVYKSSAETESAAPKMTNAAAKIQLSAENAYVEPFPESEIPSQISIVGTEKNISDGWSKSDENAFVSLPKIESLRANVEKESPLAENPEAKITEAKITDAKSGVLSPLEFSNRVETRARQPQISAEDWQTLLELIGELLGSIDETLARANLDFASAFTKARGEISGDYPFLNHASGAFDYSNGRVAMREQTSAKLFVAGINESLRRILEKLAANPKFTEVYRAAVQQILALVHRRKTLYDKFSITPQLEKILGI